MDTYSRIEGAQVVVIVELNEKELTVVGEKYGIATLYTDYNKLHSIKVYKHRANILSSICPRSIEITLNMAANIVSHV
ncbi:MAG TPA: hypothetical protein VIK78_07885 [Ruminiclostridium sp.]